MASIVHDPNGRKRISFRAARPGTPPRRRTLRLGPDVSEADAREIAGRIETLIAGRLVPKLIGAELLEWAAGLDAKSYRVLASAGLVPQRAAPAPAVTLGEFLDHVTAALSVKASTLLFYGHTMRCLLEHFGASRDLASIDARAADGFAAFLARHDFRSDAKGAPRTLAPATVARRVLLARHVFNRAVRWGIISENPFAGIKAAQQTNADRQVYVSRINVDRVLAEATDPEFKLMIALSRYGGLRCPSEHLGLTWQDVDWEHGRLLVRSPKTERHAGGASRLVPLFAELRPYLQAVFDAAAEGAVHVIGSWRSPEKNLRTRLLRTIARAGLKPWPKLFHNLRASCETDLVAEYPLVTAAGWLGHNPAIMVKHYLTNPDHSADFARAAGLASGELTRVPTRPESESKVVLGKQDRREEQKTHANAGKAVLSGGADWALQDSNSPPKASDPETPPHSDARSDAPGPLNAARALGGAADGREAGRAADRPARPAAAALLDTLALLWPELPEPVQRSIVQLAQAAARGGG